MELRANSPKYVARGGEELFGRLLAAAKGDVIAGVFAGSPVPSTFSVAFANGELLLGGFPYQRLG